MVAKLLSKTIEDRCYRHFEEKHRSAEQQGVARHREGGHYGSESGGVKKPSVDLKKKLAVIKGHKNL